MLRMQWVNGYATTTTIITTTTTTTIIIIITTSIEKIFDILHKLLNVCI